MSRPAVFLGVVIKSAIIVAAALLAFGAVERERLYWLLGGFVALRAGALWREWRKPREGDERWRELERAHAADWWREERAELAGEDADAGEPGEAELARTATRAEVRAAFARRHARRADLDIASEAWSLFCVAPGAFLLALMLTSPVVSWTGSDRGPATLALLAGVGLHFLANLIPAARPVARASARAALTACVIAPGLLVAQARHPYLLARGAEHRWLIAERVWHMGLTVGAGRHASLIADYARDLEREGRPADARTAYERALRLDAYDGDAREGLARVLEALGEHEAAADTRRAGEWNADPHGADSAGPEEDSPLPLFAWGATERLRICLVPVGDVPDALLDQAGRRMGRVLGAEVCRWPEALPLPESERRAGLLGAEQWRAGTLMDAFRDRMLVELSRGRRLAGPWQFILVTSGDLYLPDTNYVFAASFAVHGVVSCARLGEGVEPRRVARLAKQMTSTAIKCFGTGQAPRADCVTAYVRSLDELDRRSGAPAPETRAEYRRHVERWERDPSRLPEPPG